MYYIITLMPSLLCLLAALGGLWHWKRHNLFFRLMCFQALLGFLAEFLGTLSLLEVITFGREMENIPVFNLYMLFEVWLAALAVNSLFKSKSLSYGILSALSALSLIWVFSIVTMGWFHFTNWFYVSGSLFNTALLLFTLKKNLETYFLAPQLSAYLLIIFGQLLFYVASFEVVSLRFLLMKQDIDFYKRINYLLWTVAQVRMLFFLLGFLLLPRTNKTPAPAIYS